MANKANDSSQKIKVCIIDDEKTYRESLKILLQRDPRIHLYSEYDSGLSFIQDLNQPFEPDVCLVDIVLKDFSGIEIGKLIKQKNSKIHVIFMTAYPDIKTFEEASQLDADYIEKGTRGEILIDKIVTNAGAHNNEQLFSFRKWDADTAGYILLFSKELNLIRSRISLLSDFQRKVLRLRKDGKTINDIAEILQMSPHTVRTHINRGLKKLKLPSFLKFLNL